MFFLVTLAILSLTLSNVFRVFRFNLFIEPYEKPNVKMQIRSLAISNVLNIFLPFRLGYIVRILIAGKSMKNGRALMFAATIAEVLLDFIFVTAIFILFAFLGENTRASIVLYIALILSVIFVATLLTVFKKKIKRFIYNFASLFNDSISLKILKSAWFSIALLKSVTKKVDKVQLLLTSILIWVLNISACYFIGVIINESGKSLFDVVYAFFSNTGLMNSIFVSISKNDFFPVMNLVIYLLVPSLLLFILSYCIRFEYKERKYVNLLPQQKTIDRLNFLKLYFNSNDDGLYFKKYISINDDVAVIEDYSAGSNATTMLCEKYDKTFYRKYAFGKDAAKLNEQIKWIHANEKKLSLTKISYELFDGEVCVYDMPYIDGAVTCFNFVHTQPFEKAWKNLKDAITDLSNNLHKPTLRPSEIEATKLYIESKVNKNLKIIKKGEFIAPLQKYNYLYINGKRYHNLKHYETMLSEKNLLEIFKDDDFSDIHGDFTIENIVCVKGEKDSHYLIDPNTGNIHDSPFLDFAKLLQSLHGGYEFLMNTKNVSVIGNHIDFLFTKSSTYYRLCDEYVSYLEDKFGEDGLRSIFYHEAIHWLRLMPYKIEKNGERSVLFYAGLLMVLDDIEKRFKETV